MDSRILGTDLRRNTHFIQCSTTLNYHPCILLSPVSKGVLLPETRESYFFLCLFCYFVFFSQLVEMKGAVSPNAKTQRTLLLALAVQSVSGLFNCLGKSNIGLVCPEAIYSRRMSCCNRWFLSSFLPGMNWVSIFSQPLRRVVEHLVNGSLEGLQVKGSG